MVRIGTVWDQTVEVMQGRGGILAGLAGAYIFLPTVAGAALEAVAGPAPGFGVALAGQLIAIAGLVLLVFAWLAMTAVANDPAIDTREASVIAGERIGPALGIVVLLILAMTIAFAPLVLVYIAAGVEVYPTGQPDLSAVGTEGAALAVVATLAVLVTALFVSAKLVPLFGVIVNERLGLRAVSRSFGLTRGSAVRLIGVSILYGLVLGVVTLAVDSVVGVVARLTLGGGADAAVGFAVSVAEAIVIAGAMVVQTVFYARFYIAARASAADGQAGE